MRSQVPKSSRPLVTATTTSRPIICRFRWASALFPRFPRDRPRPCGCATGLRAGLVDRRVRCQLFKPHPARHNEWIILNRHERAISAVTLPVVRRPDETSPADTLCQVPLPCGVPSPTVRDAMHRTHPASRTPESLAAASRFFTTSLAYTFADMGNSLKRSSNSA